MNPISMDDTVMPSPSATPGFTASASVTPPPPPPSPSPAPASAAPVPVRAVTHKSPFGFLKFVFFGLVTLFIIAGAYFLFQRQTGNKQITLTYWGLWEPESVMRPLFAQFQTAHPNVKINYQMESPQEYRERLQSSLDQSKGPDIFRIHSSWVPMLRTYLSPVPASVFSAQDYNASFYPVAQTDLRLGNNYVAIPLEYDGLSMFINDDLLKNAALPVPQTWDELRTVALAMTKCESDNGSTSCIPGSRILISGAALGTTTNVDHWQDILSILLYQNNVNILNPGSPTTRPAEDVIDYYSGFAQVNHVWDPNVSSSTQEFAGGRVGIYFGPSWRVFDILAANPGLKFTVYPLPQVPLDPVRNEKAKTLATYWAEAVNKKSPNAQMAWELLKFLSSKDNLPKLYQASVSPARPYGEPYSRTDLAAGIKDSQYIGTFISQAPLAKSSYLASFTYDGPSGINSRVSDLYAQAVNRTLGVDALGRELNQVLSGYGITATQ